MSERRAYNEGYDHGVEEGIMRMRRMKHYNRPVKYHPVWGWVLVAIVLSTCMAILTLVPFPGLGTP